MNVKFINLKNQLTKGFFPVAAAVGDDAYLRSKAVERITDSLKIVLPDINVANFDDAASADDILYACESLPFGSVKKLVVADFSNAAKFPYSSAEKEKFLKYFVNPAESCCLVFVSAAEFDLFKNEKILLIDCGKLDKSSLVRWIKAKFFAQNKKIDDTAAELLLEYCLYDMTRISTETEKLASYSDYITENEVKELVHKDIEYRVYDLSNNISAKRGDKAFGILDSMLNGGEEATGLLALLYNFYRRMYYISVSGGSDAEIAEKLGVKEFAVTKTRDILKRYTQVKLKNALSFFEKAETNIKSTWGRDEEQLKNVVLKLLNL